MSNIKYILVTLIFLTAYLLLVTPIFAHVTVKPGEVGIGSRQNFVVSVPTEETTPTTQVRLVIPEGVKSVRPNVKPGWNIELKKSGEGETAKVTEIIWSGGRIPAELKDEFIFSAQAPAEITTLAWKAYQTYGDGMVVAWDSSPQAVQDYTKSNPTPVEGHDHMAPKQYSETKVINDLKSPTQTSENTVTSTQIMGDTQSNLPLILSSLALLISAITLGLMFRKKLT